MSRDFQLAFACPHLTIHDYVPIASDRRSLRTRQPIANAGIVRILVNDEFYIPQSGFYSQGVLTSSLAGPYDIQPGADTLTIKTSVGEQSHTFLVSALVRYTADQIVQFLQKAGIYVAELTVNNGHLVFTDTAAIGQGSFVEVSGTAVAALGFGVSGGSLWQRKAQGAQIYPPWSLATQIGSTDRYPCFQSVVKGNPVFKVSYASAGNRCLRCGGTFIENDIRFDASGQSFMVENEDLLYQASLKLLLTDRGSNPYHPWYGTDLRSRIGSKAIAGVATLISEDVRKALGKLQSLQVEQSKYQTVTFKERLYVIMGVEVKPHQQDPTTFLVDVTVRNAASKPITLNIVYTAPSVVALMGSNGLMLGTNAVGI